MKQFRTLSTEEQAQAEAKKAKMKQFIDQVAEMSEEQLTRLKERINIITCDGHSLSLKNNALLDLQAEGIGLTVSVVGGFSQWLDKGRVVKKGERAFCIMAPSSGKAKDKAGKVRLAEDGSELTKTYFKLVSVFDISQTEVVTEESEVKKVELALV
jgi:hypothetical protein